MTYFSHFTSHHTNFKRIHHDSEERKPCRVENDTKTVNRCLSPVSMGLILLSMDHFKVFRLSKNNFLGNSSFIANQK